MSFMYDKKRIVLLITTLFILLFPFNNSVDAKTDGIGFEIAIEKPASQIDRSLGYYYVQTAPGKNQEITLKVISTSDKEMIIQTYIENAVSSDHGGLVYSTDLEELSSNVKNPMSEILVPNKTEITLAPRDTAYLTYTLNVPKESYDGIKMGRIVVNEKSEDSSGLGEVYQYALGFMATETGEEFNIGDILEYGTAVPKVINGSRVVEMTIENPDPYTIEKLSVVSYVTKKGETKKLKEKNVKNFYFAPNSKLGYTIPWGLSNFEAGDYTLHFEAENAYDTFSVKKDFTIRGSEAKSLNNQTAFKVRTSKNIKIIIVSINILALVLFIYIMIRDKKWLAASKKRRGKHRKKVE